MAHFYIKAVYRYEGMVEADTPDDAEKVFWKEMNDHYASTEDYECTQMKVCDCGYEGEMDEFEGDECDGCQAEREGECDECEEKYDTSSRDGRCGDCGNCATCCDHDNNEDGE